MSAYADRPLHYVILGAGAAGTLLALELAKISSPDFRITLIDNKDFHEYTPSIIDVVLQPSVSEMRRRLNVICPLLSDMFKGTRVEILKGEVLSINSEEVILKNSKVSYSHLVICTGSSYSAPYKLSIGIETVDQRFDDLRESREKIESASSLLCIGGGPVGVEMVGELAARYPEKKITLVHSKPELLEKLPGNLGRDAKISLEDPRNGASVEIILDEKAEVDKDSDVGAYVTSKTKKVITPQHVISSSGLKPNSGLMKEKFSHCLDENNFIIVDDFFRVCRQSHIFAIGDVNNNADPKLYFTAHMQAVHLSKILYAEMTGKIPSPYKGSKLSYAISLGPEVGLLSLSDGFISIRGLRSSVFKSHRRGSRFAVITKQMIEKASLSGCVASVMNQVLYYTSTK